MKMEWLFFQLMVYLQPIVVFNYWLFFGFLGYYLGFNFEVIVEVALLILRRIVLVMRRLKKRMKMLAEWAVTTSRKIRSTNKIRWQTLNMRVPKTTVGRRQ